MLVARAEYADGTTVKRYFDDSACEYELECWLVERHENCVWYSVEYMPE